MKNAATGRTLSLVWMRLLNKCIISDAAKPTVSDPGSMGIPYFRKMIKTSSLITVREHFLADLLNVISCPVGVEMKSLQVTNLSLINNCQFNC